jgi:hypothetical protein
MPEHEEPLAGGNLTPVVRMGETVQRTQGSWSDAVHDLSISSGWGSTLRRASWVSMSRAGKC